MRGLHSIITYWSSRKSREIERGKLNGSFSEGMREYDHYTRSAASARERKEGRGGVEQTKQEGGEGIVVGRRRAEAGGREGGWVEGEFDRSS